MLKYSVGLDVSSKDIHACISAIDAKQKVRVIFALVGLLLQKLRITKMSKKSAAVGVWRWL